jgi:ARID/BRIGHT DNA binding domain
MIFHARSGSKLKPVVVDDKIVDFFHLKNSVAARGGFEQVTREAIWHEVANDLKIDARKQDALGILLKASYIKWIVPFEKFLTEYKESEGDDTSVDPMNLSEAESTTAQDLFVEKSALNNVTSTSTASINISITEATSAQNVSIATTALKSMIPDSVTPSSAFMDLDLQPITPITPIEAGPSFSFPPITIEDVPIPSVKFEIPAIANEQDGNEADVENNLIPATKLPKLPNIDTKQHMNNQPDEIETDGYISETPTDEASVELESGSSESQSSSEPESDSESFST